MTLSASMILVDQTAVPLATPHVIEDLGGQLNESQWILTANILPLAAFMVLGGRLGDLFGLRRVFLTGAVLFAISTWQLYQTIDSLHGGEVITAADVIYIVISIAVWGAGVGAIAMLWRPDSTAYFNARTISRR